MLSVFLSKYIFNNKTKFIFIKIILLLSGSRAGLITDNNNHGNANKTKSTRRPHRITAANDSFSAIVSNRLPTAAETRVSNYVKTVSEIFPLSRAYNYRLKFAQRRRNANVLCYITIVVLCMT